MAERAPISIVGIFEQMIPCAWEAKGKAKIAFPVLKITELFHNRLIPRKRPYRRGAKLDSTGPDPMGWELECLFHNGHLEPGVKGDELYPDEVNRLCDSFVEEETGTLTLSTRGPRRCKLDNYRREESAEVRDAARLTLVFTEDSEDNFDAASFQAPSAKSVIRRLMQECVLAMEEEGAWDGDIGELEELGAELEGLANAPGEFANDIDAKATAISNRVDRVEKAFTNAANAGAQEATALLLDPRSSRAGRLLRRVSDTARRSGANVLGLGTIEILTFPRQVSLFDVAAERGLDPARMLLLNPGIANPIRVPPRTPIRAIRRAA